MYKASKFNRVYKDAESMVVFNMITGKLVKIESKDVRESLCNNIGLESLKCFDELVGKGFVVSDETDEDVSLEYALNEMVYDRALELIILPTTRCNFRCEYCYQDFSDADMDLRVQDSIIKYVKSNIKKYTGLRVNWYGGEPLVGRNVINYLSSALIDICRRMGKPYISSMTTNGYLLNEKVFSEMIDNNIVSYVITIDGTEETHNKYRHLKDGRGTFNTIIDNLINIRDRVPKKFFSVLIRGNITKSTLEGNLLDLVHFLEKEFGEDKRFEFLFYPVADWGGTLISNLKNDICKSYEEIYDFLIKNRVSLNMKPFYKYLKLGSCWAAKRNSFLISPKGIIKKCTLLVNRKEHDVGYINENGEMVLDENLLARWILRRNTKGDMCMSCEKRVSCVSYCPLIKNFSVSNFTCEFDFFAAEKILELLLKSGNLRDTCVL